jgi:hypothetical protein
MCVEKKPHTSPLPEEEDLVELREKARVLHRCVRLIVPSTRPRFSFGKEDALAHLAVTTELGAQELWRGLEARGFLVPAGGGRFCLALDALYPEKAAPLTKAFSHLSSVDATNMALRLRMEVRKMDKGRRSWFEGDVAVHAMLRLQQADSVQGAAKLGAHYVSSGVFRCAPGNRQGGFRNDNQRYRFYLDEAVERGGGRGHKTATMPGSWLLAGQGFRVFLALLASVCVLAPVVAILLGSDEDGYCKAESPWLCANTGTEYAFLILSRGSAGLATAALCFCFLTKMHNLRRLVQESQLESWISFEPVHHLHVTYGYVMVLAILVHGGFHVARLAMRDGTNWGWQAIVSGIAALGLFLLATVPMVGRFRRVTSFEARKSVHYLVLPGTIALAFHGPRILWIVAIVGVGYVLDALFGFFCQTFRVDEPLYSAVGQGTCIAFRSPPGFRFVPGQYVYVCIPFISPTQWHALSIMPAVDYATEMLRNDECWLYVAAVGDWSAQLFLESLTLTRRPMYLTRPLPSPLASSVHYDDVLLVGTGAGITPLVSIINAYAGSSSKNITLLWSCRDAALMRHMKFLRPLVRCIFYYTGTSDADFASLQRDLSTTPVRQAQDEVDAPFFRAELNKNTSRLAITLEERLASGEHEIDGPEVLIRGRPKFDQVVRSIVGGEMSAARLAAATSNSLERGMMTSSSTRKLHTTLHATFFEEEEEDATHAGQGWSCIYSGSSAPVAAALRDVSKALSMSEFTHESFGEW